MRSRVRRVFELALCAGLVMGCDTKDVDGHDGSATAGETGGETGDVGAPCGHGTVEPPQSLVTRFPAVACNDLICVFPFEGEIPQATCSGDADCNPEGGTTYLCNVDRGRCELGSEYVIDRSMCSKTCTTDDECNGDHASTGTRCEGGFHCARIQALGQFCCQKLCVCADDLAPDPSLDAACEGATQVGCCVDELEEPITPRPEGCSPS